MSPLPYGTTRSHMASQLHLVASVGAQLFGGNDQYEALMRVSPSLSRASS